MVQMDLSGHGSMMGFVVDLCSTSLPITFHRSCKYCMLDDLMQLYHDAPQLFMCSRCHFTTHLGTYVGAYFVGDLLCFACSLDA